MAGAPALVIGESLVDLIGRPGLAPVPRVGGSPLNVAVGLSRLDVPVVLHTQFGSDDYGELIAAHVRGNDVDLTTGSVTPAPTSTALATIAEDGSAHYDFEIGWDPEPVPATVGSPVLVHTGSIAAVLEPGARLVAATVEAHRSSATISYDPNVRPQLMGHPAQARARIEALVALADVVKASDEDLAWLFPGETQAAVAERWLELGAGLVVVTRGGDGALAVGRAATVEVGAPPVTVVDTVGAGDSFMAGLLAALSDEDLVGRESDGRLRTADADLLRRLAGFAVSCAAVTVSRLGADPPRRAALTPA